MHVTQRKIELLVEIVALKIGKISSLLLLEDDFIGSNCGASYADVIN